MGILPFSSEARLERRISIGCFALGAKIAPCTMYGATGCTVHGAKASALDPKAEPKPEEREKTRACEENPEVLLKRIGLTPGSTAWIAALSGYQKDIVASANRSPCRL